MRGLPTGRRGCERRLMRGWYAHGSGRGCGATHARIGCPRSGPGYRATHPRMAAHPGLPENNEGDSSADGAHGAAGLGATHARMGTPRNCSRAYGATHARMSCPGMVEAAGRLMRG
ncbi:hypothetical protein CYMTET_19008 [Cymbomonas tetramitiformis]|uniref:Uncharacterized protein n=1 Tax=Cymbomonas tetramitiformis TaxID=36881 RepID=A0AAE0L5B8_9CHLO|nr:hypothetical protein CYMTET_19008 [Cymbomonas tetramitiformis]